MSGEVFKQAEVCKQLNFKFYLFCGALSFKVLSTCNSSNVLVFCRQIFLVVWIVTLSNIIVLSCYHFTRTLHQKDRWNPKGKFVYLFSVDLCGWARVPLQCYFGKARLFSRSNPFYTFSPFYALRETKYLQSFWACTRAYDSNELDPSLSQGRQGQSIRDTVLKNPQSWAVISWDPFAWCQQIRLPRAHQAVAVPTCKSGEVHVIRSVRSHYQWHPKWSPVSGASSASRILLHSSLLWRLNTFQYNIQYKWTRSWSGDRECGVDCSSDGHRIPRARLWIIHWAKHLLMATRRSYSLAHVVEKTKGGTCGKVCTESCDLPKNLVPSLHSTVTGSCQLSQARSVPLHHSDYSNSHFKIWKWIWIEVDHEDDKIVILYISTATS